MRNRPRYGRRGFLGNLAGLAVTALTPVRTARAARRRRLRLVVLGQAAIQHDLREHPYADYRSIAALLRNSDVCFTDLETVIDGPEAGPPTRNTSFFKAAKPPVLDCLKDFSVNLLALSNNHSWDLDTGGILSTLAAVRARGFAYAGTGRDLSSATAPGRLETGAGAVALVSMASGAIREGAAATATRPGVNELRVLPDGTLDEQDAARNLAAISSAARTAPYVVAYQHNHYWEPDFRVTPAWQRRWARQCIDAGACAFVSHGAPLLQGVDIYRDRPIFHDLGSLVFHSRTPIGYYPAEVWDSAIAACTFEDGRLVALEFTPVLLDERGVTEATFYETRGRPAIARGAEAARVLGRLQRLSPRIELRGTGERARVVL